jgi:hypothetical protein
MKQFIGLYVIVIISLFFIGCAPSVITMKEAYPKMYENPPVSILILPPINNSTAAEAKEYFSCSLSEAIGLKGYYPFSVENMYRILREEGLYDTEMLSVEVLSNFKKYFDADAVLYSSIEKWDKSWFLTSGNLTIIAKFSLLSTTAADTLWNYTSEINVSLGSQSQNFLVAMIESAIKTAVEDYFPNALKANVTTMEGALPKGKYDKDKGSDKDKTIPSNKRGKIVISK